MSGGDPRRFASLGNLEADTLYKTSMFPDSFRFPYNPDPLCGSNNYSIYDEMRDDDQVKAVLSLKKDMLLNSGWSLSGDDEACAFVEENLKAVGRDKAMGQTFDDALRDMASFYDYGFSLGEPVWRSPANSASGKWELREVRVRPPHSFTFHINDAGDVEKVEQYGSRGTKTFKPDIFIHNVYQSDFGNPYGKSDLKAMHAPWKAKKFLFRMAMRYAERFAGGTVVGKYNPSAGPAEIAAFSAAVQSLQDSTTLILPNEERMAVEILQTNRDSSETYQKMLHMLNTWIARSGLIPDLIGMSGEQTSGGSLALGREHFKLLLSTIANDRASIERRVNSRIVHPLASVNFGQAKCEFSFKPIDTGDEQNFLKLWIEAVNGKVFKPNEDEVNHLRRKTGFPEGPVEVPEPPAPSPGFPGAQEQPGMQGAPEKPADDRPEMGEPGEAKEDMGRRFDAARTPNAFEHKVDFKRISATLEASEAKAHRQVSEILRRMGSDMVERARDRGLLERFKPEALAELEPKFRKELNSMLKGHFIHLFREGVESASAEVLPRRKDFVAADLYPEDFEELIRAESFKMVGDLSNEVRKRFSNQAFEAIKNGRPASSLAERLAEDIRGYTESQVRTVLRTKTTEVFNAARKTFFETDPVASGLIDGYAFSAVMDDSTTEICESLHGEQYSRDEVAGRPEITPPLHWNCRSMLVPITKFEPKKFTTVPSAETLRRRGGNLVPGGKE